MGEGLHMGWQCHEGASQGQKQHSSGGELGLPTRAGLAFTASLLAPAQLRHTQALLVIDTAISVCW